MDLAIGAKKLGHDGILTKTGESKLVQACTYPLTGIGCVSRIYSDLAVLDFVAHRAVWSNWSMAEFEQLQALTAVPLTDRR